MAWEVCEGLTFFPGSQFVFSCSAPMDPFLGLTIAFKMGILMASEGRDTQKAMVGFLVKSYAPQTPNCCPLHLSQLENQPLRSASSYFTYLVGGT